MVHKYQLAVQCGVFIGVWSNLLVGYKNYTVNKKK